MRCQYVGNMPTSGCVCFGLGFSGEGGRAADGSGSTAAAVPSAACLSRSGDAAVSGATLAAASSEGCGVGTFSASREAAVSPSPASPAMGFADAATTSPGATVFFFGEPLSELRFLGGTAPPAAFLLTAAFFVVVAFADVFFSDRFLGGGDLGDVGGALSSPCFGGTATFFDGDVSMDAASLVARAFELRFTEARRFRGDALDTVGVSLRLAWRFGGDPFVSVDVSFLLNCFFTESLFVSIDDSAAAAAAAAGGGGSWATT